MKMRKLFYMVFIGVVVASCKKATENLSLTALTKTTTEITGGEVQANTVNTSPVNIVWDSVSRKINGSEYFADYGRIHRAPNGNLILTYGGGTDASHTRVHVIVRRSSDNGITWTTPQTVMDGFSYPGYSGFCNPDLLVMQNGWLMLAFVGKGNPDNNAHDNILYCISTDNGVTWGTPHVVAWGRGWEPEMIQLPDGDIEMFWSSEAAWFPSSNVQQEVLMSHSTDNGTTWSTPKQVAYTSGYRDGMPSPILLQNGSGIAFALEDVGRVQGPDVVYSSLADRWNQTTIGSYANGRRWEAVSDNINGRAPFLTQITTGQTVMGLMAENGRNTGGNFMKNEELVYIGDNQAKNFKRVNDPWPDQPDSEGTYYSSLFNIDATHVILVTTRNRADGHSEIWWKHGHIADLYSKSGWTINAVSSEEPNNGRLAVTAIDGDVNTCWIARYSTNATSYPNHYITIDFGTQLNCNGLSVAQKFVDRKVKVLKVMSSTDNVTWEQRGIYTLRELGGLEQLLQFPGVRTFRYMKLIPMSGYDSYQQPGIAEIGVYKMR